MKEKNTAPSKGKSILCLMVSLIATLLVSSIIYFLVFHPLLTGQQGSEDGSQYRMDLLLSVCL